MESPDIQAKYQKLASEYTKLRAQNQVLKKAVVEEQGKTSQLTDLIKLRDQSLRRAEQEIDSLNFRNQQLTTRLSLLQDDLEELQFKNKKSWPKGEASSDVTPYNSVLTEELQAKIQENAKLHAQLSETENRYVARVAELEVRLQEAMVHTEKQKEYLNKQQEESKKLQEKIESERSHLEFEAKRNEGLLKSAHEEIDMLHEKLGEKEVRENEVVSCSKSEQQKKNIPFSDKKITELNSLNVPSQSGRGQLTARSLVEQFGGLVSDLCRAFINFNDNYVHRIEFIMPESSVKEKLMRHMVSSRGCWSTLDTTYNSLAENAASEGFVALETLSGLHTVSASFTACHAHFQKILPPFKQFIEDACKNNNFSGELEKLTKDWSCAYSRVISAWGALSSYISLTAQQSVPHANLPPNAQGHLLKLFSARLQHLNVAVKGASSAWQKLLTHEKDLPSVELQAKEANEKVMSSFVTMSVAVGKMSALFGEQVLHCWSQGGSSPSTPSSPHPSVAQFYQRAVTYMTATAQDEAASVPYETALKNANEVLRAGENESSSDKQLAVVSQRLAQVQADREHWRLEHQLLQCRHEKEVKKVRELEMKLKELLSGNSQENRERAESKENLKDGGTSIVSSSILGEVVGKLEGGDEREKEIRNYFTGRCSNLHVQLTAAVGQATLYQNECESLMRRLVGSEEGRSNAEIEVDSQRASNTQLKETLQTTARNYKEQISTMSEHLADLNEKITAQAEHIEHLQYELSNKGKKGKK
ncbi:protein phosphatase 1 regulatory subunit 21 [Oratosquilla oratoria]|uniref:protein phosphatase 1 regulatory subunit 21 n=1 Tax=Oratosquilla oratoria TaxID=337810 RepID=UPI003F7614E8